MDQKAAEEQARAANAPDLWDAIWKQEGEESWRREALSRVYSRITRLVPKGCRVLDVGGGQGLLGQRLASQAGCQVTVWDQSETACAGARFSGLRAVCVDLEADHWPEVECDVIVGTEILEHLSAIARVRLLRFAAGRGYDIFFSVPNDRLGPEEESQHTVKYTAISFLRALRDWFPLARIEVLGPYLLGICDHVTRSRISVTLPVRDEAVDLEATLASFRGVASDLVVGVDPRTVDNTREIAAKYADLVFELTTPEGLEADRVPDGGVHFSHVRNQCIDRCIGDWIFMTEGHERLVTGEDTLLAIDRVMPEAAKVGFVIRQGTGQQWAFPWLFRNDPRIRFKRATHNVLDYPEGTLIVKLPQVRTLHERASDRSAKRAGQRKVQNRKTLYEDWLVHGNENSLYYLGSEWREFDPSRAVERLRQFLALPAHNGPMRYQARLILAKTLVQAGKRDEARDVLLGCVGDDWSRTEHWIWLGDLAFDDGRLEEAMQFYRYAGTMAGEPPFTLWWIDLAAYSYMPAQRLAMCYAALGRGEEALAWAKKVRDLLPDDAPLPMIDEAEKNLQILQEAMNESRR